MKLEAENFLDILRKIQQKQSEKNWGISKCEMPLFVTLLPEAQALPDLSQAL